MKYGAHVLVCGHRGDRVHGLDNTMTAMRLAVEAGVDMIETDVRMTADGALILMHDEDVSRTTDGQGLVKELTLEQIRKCRDPEATLKNFNSWALYHPEEEIDWLHTGFFSYTRSDFEHDTREEMLAVLAEHFRLN